MESRDFADPVGTSGMKRRALGLRRLAGFSEHFTGPSEIEAAVRLQFAKGGEQVVASADIRRHRENAVVKFFGDEALRGQVIALIERMPAEDLKYRGKALETPCMQLQST